MGFCLPKSISNKFLNSIKDGTINPEKMANMTSADRHDFIANIVGEDNATHVNALFESKLLLKDYKKGLVTWAKQTSGISEQMRKDFVTKINNLNRVLDPLEERGFLADFARQKLGVGVTTTEAKTIADLAKSANDLRDANSPALAGVSDEFLKAAGGLRAYIASLKPTTALTSIGKNAAIIARNNLLMNPSTPLKTTAGQLLNSAMDMVTRRLASASIKGLNYDLVRQANSEAWKTFRETGMNTASMENLDDTGKLGEGKRFDVPAGLDTSNAVLRGIEAVTRKVAQVTNKIAIDWEHNITFTKFYQKAFYDMANIMSSNLAKSEGLSGAEARIRAAEIFKDAARVKPTTDAGATVRSLSQKNAARVTSTNSTYLSRLSIGVKDALNSTVNGLGDALMPIAKIPANIIWNGIENAGVGIPLGVKDIFQGRVKMQSEDLATKYEGAAQFGFGIQKVIRTVGVLGAAAYFTSQLTKQDFKTDRYGADYVRIGGVWVNMEYFNAVSPALAGMMNVKKNAVQGQDPLQTTGQYVAGSLAGLKNAPGISEGSDLVTAITNSNYTKGIQKYASTFFTQRGEPAFLRQLQNGQGVKGLFFSTSGLPDKAELKKVGAK